MAQVILKLKPLFTDLENHGIGRFLATTDFQRLCIESKCEEEWDRIYTISPASSWYSEFEDYEWTLREFLNSLFYEDRFGFEIVLSNILKGFIRWQNQPMNFENVLKDLELISFLGVKELRAEMDEKKKLSLVESAEILNSEFERERKEKQIQAIVELRTLKTKWRNLIAKAEIEDVIGEILKYADEVEDDNLHKEIISQSARWHRLKKQINQGTAKHDDIDIEARKINNALLDLISSISN